MFQIRPMIRPTIRPIHNNDIEEVTNLLSKSFSQDEPMSSILGLRETDLYLFMKCICVNSETNNVSYVCSDKNNKKICGVLICEDKHSKEIKLPELNQNIYKIFDLLDEISKDIDKNKNYLHIFMCAVSEEYRKQGIGKKLLNHLLLQDLNYDLIFAEATGIYSQKILTDFNFKIEKEIFYSDTTDFKENKTVHKSLQLLIKE